MEGGLCNVLLLSVQKLCKVLEVLQPCPECPVLGRQEQEVRMCLCSQAGHMACHPEHCTRCPSCQD